MLIAFHFENKRRFFGYSNDTFGKQTQTTKAQNIKENKTKLAVIKCSKLFILDFKRCCCSCDCCCCCQANQRRTTRRSGVYKHVVGARTLCCSRPTRARNAEQTCIASVSITITATSSSKTFEEGRRVKSD